MMSNLKYDKKYNLVCKSKTIVFSFTAILEYRWYESNNIFRLPDKPAHIEQLFCTLLKLEVDIVGWLVNLYLESI